MNSIHYEYKDEFIEVSREGETLVAIFSTGGKIEVVGGESKITRFPCLNQVLTAQGYLSKVDSRQVRLVLNQRGPCYV